MGTVYFIISCYRHGRKIHLMDVVIYISPGPVHDLTIPKPIGIVSAGNNSFESMTADQLFKSSHIGIAVIKKMSINWIWNITVHAGGVVLFIKMPMCSIMEVKVVLGKQRMLHLCNELLPSAPPFQQNSQAVTSLLLPCLDYFMIEFKCITKTLFQIKQGFTFLEVLIPWKNGVHTIECA